MKSPTLYYLCDVSPLLLKYKFMDLQWIFLWQKKRVEIQLSHLPLTFIIVLGFLLWQAGLDYAQQKNWKKRIAKIEEQDNISSVPESPGKEHHVFSHLCSSFVDFSGSKFRGEETPGILFQNIVLYSTSKKSFSEILHPHSSFPLQG